MLGESNPRGKQSQSTPCQLQKRRTVDVDSSRWCRVRLAWGYVGSGMQMAGVSPHETAKCWLPCDGQFNR